MKTRYWIGLLAAILIGCITFSIPLLTTHEDAAFAEIISDGQLIQTVALGTDQEIHIFSQHGGSNTISIRNGKIGVTDASCPDHHCMNRGMCSSGAQIVCLPNRLIIRFLGRQIIDSVSG